jgi:hypothetical protein
MPSTRFSDEEHHSQEWRHSLSRELPKAAELRWARFIQPQSLQVRRLPAAKSETATRLPPSLS